MHSILASSKATRDFKSSVSFRDRKLAGGASCLGLGFEKPSLPERNERYSNLFPRVDRYSHDVCMALHSVLAFRVFSVERFRVKCT